MVTKREKGVAAMERSSAKYSGDRMAKIEISTPQGRVMSLPMLASEAEALRQNLELDMARITHLTLNTQGGPILIPGDVLRQSLVGFKKPSGARPLKHRRR